MPEDAMCDTRGVGYASASDEDIQKNMGAKYHWVQVEGMNTPDVTKHVYERRRGPSDACCSRASSVGGGGYAMP